MFVLTALLLAMAGAIGLATHFGLASRFYDSTQADLWARAGVEEFVLRASELQEEAATVTQMPSPLLEKFRGHEQLLEPSARMPARVRLLLERSRDNSLSAVASPSFYDRSGEASIPPYSYDLCLEVTIGTRKLNYEARVQQRWPYALAGAGPICLVGNNEGQNNTSTGEGTRVQGPVLALQSEILDPSPDEGPGEEVSDSMAEALVPFSTGQKISGSSGGAASSDPWSSFRLQLAGDLPSWGVRSEYDQTLAPPRMVYSLVPSVFHSTTSFLDGPAYFMENLPTAGGGWSCEPIMKPVPTASRFRGPLRKDFRLWGLPSHGEVSRRRLQKLVAQPDTGTWPVVTVPSESNQLSVTGNPTTKLDGTSLRLSGGKGRIARDLNLQGLSLEECSLAVQGDCRVLRSDRRGPALRGDRASLIVHGTLMIDEAVMDAGGLGMVIYCNRFFIRSKGEYRGLIVSREGGCFFGGGTSGSPELHIRGGLVCGGNRVRIESEHFGTLSLRALTLVSTDLRYAPEYVPTLNQFAVMTLLTLVRRP